MKTLLKLFAAAWMVAGFLGACVLLNPLLFRVAARMTPVWDDNSAFSWPDVPWDCTSAEQIFFVWLYTMLVCAGFVALMAVAWAVLDTLFGGEEESESPDENTEGETT